jgi:hypothetical protein
MKDFHLLPNQALDVIDELVEYSKCHGQESDVVWMINILSTFDGKKAYDKAVAFSKLWSNIADHIKNYSKDNTETTEEKEEEQENDIYMNNCYDSFDTYVGSKDREKKL